MKKILLLGGSRYLCAVIDNAHKLGYKVITCDYLPNNQAHKYADEYYNISIVDKEAVLALAQELQIDGVMSFACDPGVVTAAYVAEKMGLPFQGSYKSTQILQDKGLFRKFLWDNGFNCPHAKRYNNLDSVYADVNFFTWPVIVKPVDSAGSKGVSKVEKQEDLEAAVKVALDNSRNGWFIVEDFLTFQGYHSSADCFTVRGELKFYAYSDQLFDQAAQNPYAPTMIIWPSTMSEKSQEYLTKETQRLMKLLEMQTGIYNIETCIGADGKPYIMEVSPRGGGCKIAEIQQLATGINLIQAEIQKAVGDEITEAITAPTIDGVWCEYVIHSDKSGVFKELKIDKNIRKKYVKVIDLSTQVGEYVETFTGANKSLGDMFLRFDTREELDQIMADVSKWLEIVLE